MKPIIVKIFKTKNELDQSLALYILEVISMSLKRSARCCIALSGGETPKNVYRQMALAAPARVIDWSRVHVFFCDERAVPPHDPTSNYGMIDREWLSHSSIPRENVHRIQGELEPTIAAEDYDQEMRKYFGFDPIIFDFILLGVGEDGHTASVFPESEVLLEKKALVRSTFSQQRKTWRVTMTIPVMNAAREILFLAAGKQKASMIKYVLDAKFPDPKIPASFIRTSEGTLSWMVDQDAGTLLKEDSSLIIERW
jgi:6-phosphogluconolactonase